MMKKKHSGKPELVKGALLYLWEEVKTMNRIKVMALGKMLKGYFSMKFGKPKTKAPRKSLSLNDR